MTGRCMLCGGGGPRVRFVKGGRRFLECRGCGLVWVDPMPEAAAVPDFYDDSYRDGRYATYAGAPEIRAGIAEHRLSAVRPLAREGRWLDVGCSTGAFLEAARRAGIEAEGIDVSAEAVAQARAAGLPARQARVEELEPEKPYGTITAFDVIEHLLDPRAFLARLRGWLVPQGVLALTLPDVASAYPRWLMRSRWFYYNPEEHLHYFSPDTISRLLSEEGFRVLHVGRAYKPISPRYAAAALALFNPLLGRLAHGAVALLPRSLAGRPVKLFLGEMLVVAERRER